MREIEIKLRVNNLDELEKKLIDSGLVISKEIKQHDVIYSRVGDTHDYIEDYEGHIAVRIRNQEGVSILTIKQQRSNELDNIEYETIVEDGETMHQILLLLGWKPEVEVKKIRKKGKLLVPRSLGEVGGEYEICLDRVEQLGDFVELEKLTNDSADPDKVVEELFEALKPYGLSRAEEEKRGYDTQIYQLKNK